MKKIVALFVSVFVLSTCLMCGCKKKDDSNGKIKDKDRDAETEEVETEEKEEKEGTKETADTEDSGNEEGTVPDKSAVEESASETSATMGPSGHIFDNGKCTDCGLLWTEYLYDAIGKLSGNTGDGYHTYTLEECDLFLSSGDTVLYSSSSKENIFIYYVHTKDENSMITLSLADSNEKYHNNTYTVLNISYKYSSINKEAAAPTYRFCYSMEIFVEPEDDIFSSKEHFIDVCNLKTEKVFFIEPTLTIHPSIDASESIKAWKEMPEDEIKALFDEYGVTYMTKDEFIDLVWEDHDNYFGSIDYGLAMLDTSLADDGVNWK